MIRLAKYCVFYRDYGGKKRKVVNTINNYNTINNNKCSYFIKEAMIQKLVFIYN